MDFLFYFLFKLIIYHSFLEIYFSIKKQLLHLQEKLLFISGKYFSYHPLQHGIIKHDKNIFTFFFRFIQSLVCLLI